MMQVGEAATAIGVPRVGTLRSSAMCFVTQGIASLRLFAKLMVCAIAQPAAMGRHVLLNVHRVVHLEQGAAMMVGKDLGAVFAILALVEPSAPRACSGTQRSGGFARDHVVACKPSGHAMFGA